MRRIRSVRGGVLLDAVVSLGVVLVGAFALYHFGLTFSQILRGASGFFGF
ncbi:MAG TPA: hypothetical protein VML94_00265 [Thermoplasmata archaeon]|nr:hypothetical protein [Thermoplasmata archaeon]